MPLLRMHDLTTQPLFALSLCVLILGMGAGVLRIARTMDRVNPQHGEDQGPPRRRPLGLGAPAPATL